MISLSTCATNKLDEHLQVPKKSIGRKQIVQTFYIQFHGRLSKSATIHEVYDVLYLLWAESINCPCIFLSWTSHIVLQVSNFEKFSILWRSVNFEFNDCSRAKNYWRCHHMMRISRWNIFYQGKQLFSLKSAKELKFLIPVIFVDVLPRHLTKCRIWLLLPATDRFSNFRWYVFVISGGISKG